MALENRDGKKISYECSRLIEELKRDIAEFGGEKLVYVITEKKEGVIIYKDYFLSARDKSSIKLKGEEKLKIMTASALLILYKMENGIF